MYGDKYKKIISKNYMLPPITIAEKINNDFNSFAGDTVGDDDICELML